MLFFCLTSILTPKIVIKIIENHSEVRGAPLVEIKLFQIDLDKPRNFLWYFNKTTHPSPPHPPYEKQGVVPPTCPRSPVSVVFCILNLLVKLVIPFTAVVPKLGVNYPSRVLCDSSMSNAEPKSQCLSVLWVITAKEIFDLKNEKFLLGLITQNHYVDSDNVSNKFGNDWPTLSSQIFREWKVGCLTKVTHSACFLYNKCGSFTMPQLFEKCHDKAIWSLSTLQSYMFKLPRCDDHLKKIYCWFAQHIVHGIHTSRYINTTVCAVKLLFSGKILFNAIFQNTRHYGFVLFSIWQPQSTQCLQDLVKPSNCFFVLFIC